MDELLRLAVSVVIAMTLLGAFVLASRTRARRRESPSAALVERLGVPPGQPAVVYLGAPAMAFEGRRDHAGNRVIVHRLLAESEPDLVRQLRIASLPATIVIGRDHAIRAVHAGVADVDRLAEQLA